MQGKLHPASLVSATDIDVLPADHELLRRDDHWVVRSPQNPGHYWGNFLIFDAPPAPGDRARWERIFTTEFDAARRHRSFAWDVTDGALGAAESEFVAHGYELETSVGLTVSPAGLRRLESENRDLEIALLTADSPHWAGVVDLWCDQNAQADHPHPDDLHLNYTRRRTQELADLVRQGRGVWAVALDGELVVGSLGVVVTGGRARFQAVDTRLSHRRRGIAARLLVDAAEAAQALAPVDHFVIVADPDYHAIGLYERVGFRRRERVSGVCLWPRDGA